MTARQFRDEAEREAWEERAGILEFDAGMPRDEAEAEAWRQIIAGRIQQRREVA